MKTYNVIITGNQNHITSNYFENQTEIQTESILNKYWDADYPKPEKDGNSYELNGDQTIIIQPNE